MAEQWRKVPEFNWYEVSSHGRVRSWRIMNHREDGHITWKRSKHPRILKNARDTKGYQYLTLFEDGRRKMWRVSRLVLTAFIGPCPPGKEAAHLNGKKENNRITNLSWSTPQENAAHKKIHGTEVSGERHPRAKLTEEGIRVIKFLDGTFSRRAIARVLQISDRNVINILKGKTWKHMS